ncbi:MAG TPA: hypothetical protein VIF62_15585, partial [Labilithrix sp.]
MTMPRGTIEEAMSAGGSVAPGEKLASLARAIPSSVVLAIVLQAIFLVVDASTDSFDAARSGEALRIVLTFAQAIAVFALLHLVLEGRKARVATGAVFFFFVFANVCRQATMGAFDYGFVHDHAKDVLTPLGWHILVAELRP